MDTTGYLNLFQQALERIDRKGLALHQLDAKVGIWLDSVVLKIQGKGWLPVDAEPFATGIFFSVWMNEDTMSKRRIYYNLHALKLRDIKTYRLQSREFAEAFRAAFKSHTTEWPNVSTKFGPLTLMEGWAPLNEATLVSDIVKLAHNFLPLAPITHKLLAQRKK